MRRRDTNDGHANIAGILSLGPGRETVEQQRQFFQEPRRYMTASRMRRVQAYSDEAVLHLPVPLLCSCTPRCASTPGLIVNRYMHCTPVQRSLSCPLSIFAHSQYPAETSRLSRPVTVAQYLAGCLLVRTALTTSRIMACHQLPGTWFARSSRSFLHHPSRIVKTLYLARARLHEHAFDCAVVASTTGERRARPRTQRV
jgi:hypothetical protein